MNDRTWILGAGMTGLAAGMASGLAVLEAAPHGGGICRSYYVVPGRDEPLAERPEDDGAYRFEIGGGHWLFGGAPAVLRCIAGMAPLTRHARRSSVFFPDRRQYVPYPIQNNLRRLDRALALAALEEMAEPSRPATTMADWFMTQFGPTLNRLFFAPFHELYTAGLHRRIAPQDSYKSPQSFALALRGSFEDVPAAGYNVSFAYPQGGLDLLARRMTERCRVEFGRRVVRIDVEQRVVVFAEGSARPYAALLSTLPLNRVMEMTGLSTKAAPDPFTSVLVLNIGASRGKGCPDDHWLYLPQSASGFHRVGFYSNVDPAFLPAPARRAADRVSIYVERSYPGGRRPAPEAVEVYADRVIDELREWGFIDRVEALHPTWIDVAYTWSWPGSTWREEALQALQDADIWQVGRYGRWRFQGIAESIAEGFAAGASFRSSR